MGLIKPNKKYKQLFDAECIIIGYKKGSGKYKDMLGEEEDLKSRTVNNAHKSIFSFTLWIISFLFFCDGQGLQKNTIIYVTHV